MYILRFLNLKKSGSECWICQNKKPTLLFLHVTFFWERNKNDIPNHITKFEIPSFFTRIHKNSNFLSLIWHDTFFKAETAMKYFVFMNFIKETKNFKFWSVEMWCHFCSFLRKSHLYNKFTRLRSKMKKLNAKQTHGLIESLLFVSIILTCFFLVLRTSIRTENISKHGKCAYKNKRGLVGKIYFDMQLIQMIKFHGFCTLQRK